MSRFPADRMRRAALVLALMAPLAACGADGAPERPAAVPGMTISGSVQAGIARDGG